MAYALFLKGFFFSPFMFEGRRCQTRSFPRIRLGWLVVFIGDFHRFCYLFLSFFCCFSPWSSFWRHSPPSSDRMGGKCRFETHLMDGGELKCVFFFKEFQGCDSNWLRRGKLFFSSFQGSKDAGLTGFGSFIANRLLHSVERNTMCISLVSFCFGGRSRLSTCVAQFLRRDQTEVTEESVGLFIIIFLSRQMCRNIHLLCFLCIRVWLFLAFSCGGGGGGGARTAVHFPSTVF